MTFVALENSVDDGIPIELYEFNYHTTYWRYTNTDKPIVYNSQTYEPLPITRGNIGESKEMNKKRLKVSLPRNAGVGELFRISPPSQVVSLTIYFNHFGDTDFVASWVGRVLSGRWDKHKLHVTCEPSYTSLKRAGLRRKYQYQCPHVLYSSECGLSSAENEQIGIIGSLVSNIIVVDVAAGEADNHYAGGFIAWSNPETLITDYRMILSSATDGTLTLAYLTTGLKILDSVRIYRGCPHNIAGCKSFGNLENYGGFPYIPNLNPFGGTIIF